MLDGTLSEDNANLLTREMAKDPGLSSQLDELMAIRRSLLSGRTVAYLGPDFASSVTNAAKKRAIEMGADAPEWLNLRERKASPAVTDKSDFGRPIAPTPKVQPQWIRWTYASVLAVATGLVLLAFSLPKSAKQGFVSNFKTGKLIDEPSRSNDSDYADTKQATEDSEKVTQLLTEKIADNSGSNTKQALDPFDVAEIELNRITEPKSDLSIIIEPIEMAGPIVAESTKSNLALELVPDPRLNGQLAASIPHFVIVLDVSVDPIAIEGRTLERILEKYGIVFTDDLIISDEQLKQLVDSRLVGDTKALDEESMGVLFLRSSGEKLSLALREIEARFQDFPEYAFSMSQHDSVIALVQQLEGIRVVAGTNGSAQRLAISKNQETKKPFAASIRHGKTKSNETRLETGKRNPLISIEGMANALILIRLPKK